MNILYVAFLIVILIKLLTIEHEKKAIHYFFDKYSPTNKLLQEKDIINDLNKFIQNYLQKNYKFIGNFQKDFEKIIAKLILFFIHENINEKEDYRKIKNEVFINNLLTYYHKIYEKDNISNEEVKISLIQSIIDELTLLNIDSIFSLYKSVIETFSLNENDKYNFHEYLQHRNKIIISFHRLDINRFRFEKYISYILTKNPTTIHEN